MVEKLTLKDYENIHNLKFPNSIIKITKREGEYIYFETEFGLCKKSYKTFGKSGYDIRSAINKTDYFLNQLIRIYKDKFDYSLTIFYNNVREMTILICKIHNIEFKNQINSVLSGKACCPLCSKLSSREKRSIKIDKFIDRANKIHNNKYDYSKTIYDCNKVNIICNKHGEFYQSPHNHLTGYGCIKCGIENTSKHCSDNPIGWSLTNWEKAGKISKKFDSFKVYIIRCWNETEEFYKIGRTYREVKYRFSGKSSIPYNYEILSIFENDAKSIYNLENKLKNINKEYKYKPLLNFNGKEECFSKLKNKNFWEEL